MPALFSKTALLFALICSHVSAGAIASPVNASDIKSKSFCSDEIAQRAVKNLNI